MTIVFVAIAMITVIMTFVIPKIEGMYKEANVNLPGITQGLIDTSHFIKDNLFLILVVFGGAVIGGMFALKNRAVRKWFDGKILHTFIFGNILRKQVLITFCEFLSTLLSAGILINKALLIVRNGIGNLSYEDEILTVIEEIKSGKTLSSTMGSDLIERKNTDLTQIENKLAFENALRRSEFFPIELGTAVKIGEQTGTLGKMLDRVSTRYNKEVDGIIKNLSAMLEPVIILVL
jgi:type IV pilus assembly protein PilC